MNHTAIDPRITRATNLGNELLVIMHRLADQPTGVDAVLFLDRRARCRAFHADELQRAGIVDLVALADDIFRSHGEALGEDAADSLDLEGLLTRTYAAASGESVDVVDLAMDALLVGTVVDAFPAAARERAVALCEELVAVISGTPEAFKDASVVALDRARYERPSRMPLTTRNLIGALRAAPRLAAYDAEHEHEDVPEEAREQMEVAIKGLRSM